MACCLQDGNGILDREEVRHLLQSDGRCTAGICMIAQVGTAAAAAAAPGGVVPVEPQQ
jgi:hypothetical protein